MCVCRSCVPLYLGSTLWICSPSRPLSYIGSLWAGRSLTASVREQGEDGKCVWGCPLHRHTAGVCSRSSRTGERHGREWGAKESDFALAQSAWWVVGLEGGVRECVCHSDREVPLHFFFFFGLSEKCEMTARMSNIVLMAIRGWDLQALPASDVMKCLHWRIIFFRPPSEVTRCLFVWILAEHNSPRLVLFLYNNSCFNTIKLKGLSFSSGV